MKNVLASLICFLPLLGMGQTIQDDVTGFLDYNSNQVVSLAEAIPEDKYDWRPAEGIRSVGEAVAHIASAHYYLAMSAGATLPEGLDIMTMESTLTEKADLIEALKKSYSFVKDWAKSVLEENFEDQVELPFGTFSKRQMYFLITSHSSEHLGQLIAYARSNGITPPWSQ
jgi:uncharacterized damage-inducible protein DinB